MFCNECGTEFVGVEKCPKCGHPAESVEQAIAGQATPPVQGPVISQQTAAAVRRPMSKAKLITYIIMWALCAAGIIFGIMIIVEPLSYYSYGDWATFGGDFYTEIHARTEEIVDNTHDIGEDINRIAGAFMILLSSFKACSTALAFLKDKNNG